MNDIGTVAAAIAEARTRAGLTQRQLAERAGTSQPAIARLEAGLVQPTLDTLDRIATALGCDLHVELAPKPAADPITDAFKRDVDRTLLRENLRRTVDERLRSLEEWHEFATTLSRATKSASKRRKRRT